MNFSGCHPFTIFFYFIVVLSIVVINKNPIVLLISLFFAFMYKCVKRKNFRKAWRELLFLAVIVCIFTITVPLFSHNGITPLFFINNNALTKEAIFLGLCTGIQVSTFLYWFSCMSELMTGEMIIFLVSGISSRLAAALSGIMKFIPAAAKQFMNIYKSQKNIYPGFKPFRKKVHFFLKSIPALMMWIIENSADMSDSMYARGYGILRKRTSISIYKIRITDRNIVLLTVAALIFTALSAAIGNTKMLFYPEIDFPEISVSLILIYILWSILMAMPYLTEICEEYRWKLLRSKI